MAMAMAMAVHLLDSPHIRYRLPVSQYEVIKTTIK